MSQSLRQKLALREVCRLGPPEQPKTLMTGMRWDHTNNAASHATSDSFKDRQIARGLVPRERKP